MHPISSNRTWLSFHTTDALGSKKEVSKPCNCLNHPLAKCHPTPRNDRASSSQFSPLKLNLLDYLNECVPTQLPLPQQVHPLMAEQQESQQPRSQTGFSAPKPPPKRLILCCDGTWQASDHGTQEVPSNITKLSRAISKTFVNSDHQAVPQIVHYDAGVATADWIDDKVSGETDLLYQTGPSVSSAFDTFFCLDLSRCIFTV